MAIAPEQALGRHGSLYRRLLWLYPASFRRDYGQAMVQLFCDRLRDQAGDRPRKAAVRVWLQTLRDLAVSVPNQRIEAFMSEPQTMLVQVIVMVVLSIAAILFIGFYAVVLLAAVTGWLVYQRGRGRYVRLPGQSKWHRWVLSGAALLAVGVSPAVLSLDELTDWAWGVFSLLTLGGLITVAVGVAMAARDLRHRRGGATAA